MPRFADTTGLVIFVPDPFDFQTQLCIPLPSRRSFGRVSEARQAMVVCRRRNRQDPAIDATL